MPVQLHVWYNMRSCLLSFWILCLFFSFACGSVGKIYICGSSVFTTGKNPWPTFSNFLILQTCKKKTAFLLGEKKMGLLFCLNRNEAALALVFWGVIIGCCLVNHCSKEKEKEWGFWRWSWLKWPYRNCSALFFFSPRRRTTIHNTCLKQISSCLLRHLLFTSLLTVLIASLIWEPLVFWVWVHFKSCKVTFVHGILFQYTSFVEGNLDFLQYIIPTLWNKY